MYFKCVNDMLSTYSNDVLKQFLSFCPNLKGFDFGTKYLDNTIDIMALVGRDKDIAPKLEWLKYDLSEVTDLHRVDEEIDKWTQWAYKYRLTMKHLIIRLPSCYIYDEIISCVTIFDQLRSLGLTLIGGESGLSVEHHIR